MIEIANKQRGSTNKYQTCFIVYMILRLKIFNKR